MHATETSEANLLSAILDSWDRNNRILVNLLRALPPGGLDARVMPASPSVTEMFTHIIYVRLVFVEEDAPEHAAPVPSREWASETDPERIANGLEISARVVRNAVEDHLGSGVPSTTITRSSCCST